MAGNGAIDLWGDWYDMWMYTSTGDVVVGKRSIDLY